MDTDTASEGQASPMHASHELPQGRAPYPPEVEEMFEEAGVGIPDSEADYGEDEEVYFVDQECTGLQDIVFTGVVSVETPRHAT